MKSGMDETDSPLEVRTDFAGMTQINGCTGEKAPKSGSRVSFFKGEVPWLPTHRLATATARARFGSAPN